MQPKHENWRPTATTPAAKSATSAAPSPKTSAPVAAAPTAPAYTNGEIRERVALVFGDDVSRGRERLALALVQTGGLTIAGAIAALRTAGRDAACLPSETSEQLFARRDAARGQR